MNLEPEGGVNPPLQSGNRGCFSRILVVRSAGALGDVVLSLPVIDALRRAFPTSHIELAGQSSSLRIAAPSVDAVVSLPESYWKLFDDTPEVPESLGEYLGSFDLIVVFASPDDPSVRTIEGLCSATVAVNPHPAEGFHACDSYLSALEPIGVRGSGIPRVRLTDNAEREVDETLHDYGLDECAGIVAYAHGSGSAAKNWPEHLFRKVIGTLNEGTSSDVIQIVGPVESGEGPPAVEDREEGGIVVRNLPIPVLAALLRRCSVYIGNDSGVTHLAAAAGAPTVALFGPTDPSMWGPRGDRVAILTSARLDEVVAVARTLRTAVMCEALA